MKTILTFGFSETPPVGPPKILEDGGTNAEELKKKIVMGIEKAKEAGYVLEPHLIHPTKDLDGQAEIVRQKLKAKKYDGEDGGAGNPKLVLTTPVIFGFGIRGNEHYTLLFEQLVNVVIEEAPGLRMGFNTDPSDLFDAIKRF